MEKCIVKYKVASYEGEEIIYCEADDEKDRIIAKARRQIINSSPGGFLAGTQSMSLKIISREPTNDI